MHAPSQDFLSFVNESMKMRYVGSFIHLEDFKGPIIMQSNVFTGNIQRYDNCDVSIISDEIIGTITKTIYVQNFRNRKHLQMRGLIFITKHQYDVEIYNNSFDTNFGVKGAIYIETQARTGYPNKILIAANNFTKL